MITKNEEFEVEIVDINTEGEGIGKTDAFIWFIKDTVPGDVIIASCMKVKKNYGYARMVRIIKPSLDRVEAACKVARACGGCALQTMSYEAQLKYKLNKVRNNLIRIGGFDPSYIDSIAEDIIGMDDPFRYRNKAIVPFGRDKDGNVIYGFFARHSHDIISCDDCMLGSKENKEILDTVRKYYDDAIRNVLIKRGFATGETMVCIITLNADRPDEKMTEELVKIPGVKTIVQNINPDDTNVVLGEKERVLYGSGYIEDYIGELRFRISSKSFFQVNPVQMRKLYGKAIDYAELKGTENVWDLYCGIGSISLSLAKKAKSVTGVEIVPQAIEDAKLNAEINGIKNAFFYTGSAGDIAAELAKGNGEISRPDVIVVDPPRKGLDQLCIDAMLSIRPEKIVYVSCDSATLARDLKIICDGGYKFEKYCPVDMFPMTVHVETVVLMSRVDK